MTRLVTSLDPVDITALQYRFVTEFLLDYKSGLAATRCGITPTTASRWLKLPKIKEFIAEESLKRVRKCQCSLDEVLIELHNIAMFDHSYYKEFPKDSKGRIKVKIKDFETLDLSAVESVSLHTEDDGESYMVIKPYNKMEALRLLLDYFKHTGAQNAILPDMNETDIKGKSAMEIAADYHTLLES